MTRFPPFWVFAITSALVAGASYTLPDEFAATGVGLIFLGATYLTALHDRPESADYYGLSLGGLLDREPLTLSRLLSASAQALGLALLTILVVFPFYVLGFIEWFGPSNDFSWTDAVTLRGRATGNASALDLISGHLLVVALPEEAFFRGYLQSALSERFPNRARFLGANIGWAIPITSTLFAVGHLLTNPSPERLAVFFPSLLFGWLRQKTGGIGAGVLVHAAANLLVLFLVAGFGL